MYDMLVVMIVYIIEIVYYFYLLYFEMNINYKEVKFLRLKYYFVLMKDYEIFVL